MKGTNWWISLRNMTRSSEETSQKVKRLHTQIPLHAFDAFRPISVIRFLSALMLACYTNEIHVRCRHVAFSLLYKELIRCHPQRTSLSIADVFVECDWSEERNVQDLPRGGTLSPPDLRFRPRYCRNRCSSYSLH